MNKVSKEKMVLHLPFDEDAGSARAYNYAPNRTADTDGILSGDCAFRDAEGYLMLHGEDAECHVEANLLRFSGEFTLVGYIRTNATEITLVMNYSDQRQEYTHAVTPGEWYFVCIQRVLMGSDFYTRMMVDEQMVYNEPAVGNPVGCFVTDNTDDHSIAMDDVKAWNRALSFTEIFALMRSNEDVEYYVDGINFKTFGVEVSDSHGLLDALARKEPLRVDWDNYHGETVSLNRPRFQRREIRLECFIVASDNYAFVQAVNRFIAAFNKSGTVRLTCEYDGASKPLEFDVYRDEAIEVDKTWSEELMVGTFEITLIEPSPVKRVLKYICQSAGYAEFTITTSKKINVTWGDCDNTCQISTDGGTTWTSLTRSANIGGSAIKVRHYFASAGEYTIVIHGVIEDITSFSTDCIVVWNKL